MTAGIVGIMIALGIAAGAVMLLGPVEGNAWMLVGAVGAIVVYFVPAMVADLRAHRNASAILVLNLFLGWTFIGWVAALVWACVALPESRS